ncbi:PKD domain-containing protein [Kitasatospora sp. NPDC002227]|uniref:PKD domain-containing protein n=1 Tax=Kitasatospora sp. NPDC002227 TaxID=3154773 RepID=UPI00332FF78B
MSSVRRRRQLAAAFVVASTGLAGGGLTLPAVAADVTTLYVDNSATAHCSDSGPGSQAQPFCTVQEGADAVQPGQTVSVATGTYQEQVTVRQSGEPGKPIVIKAARPTMVVTKPIDARPGRASTFVLDHVHDVTVQGFGTEDVAAEAFLVKDSERVTLDANKIARASVGSYSSPVQPPAVPSGSPAVRVTGASSGVVVSRNTIGGGVGGGVVVDPGVSGTTITTNAVTVSWKQGGISVTDAPGTVITSNTVLAGHPSGVTLAGHSDHAVVENNVIAYSGQFDPAPPAPVELSVSADSVAGTKADYNSVYPADTGTAYSWAGTTYQQPGEFSTATGQGAHDLREKPAAPLGIASNCVNCSVAPTEASGSTDSADASAPGELTTDLYGRPRVDALGAANTGTGTGYFDRGAAELEEYGSYLAVGVTSNYGPYPLTATVTASVEQHWPDTTTYTYDFGDGSDPLVTTDAKVQHVYRTKGSYRVAATARGTSPDSTVSGQAYTPVQVNEPGDLVPDLQVVSAPHTSAGPLTYAVDVSHTVSPWRVSIAGVDFGDGTPVNRNSISYHTYLRPGDYTVTATLKDEGGRTATVSKQVHVGYGRLRFTPITPTRVLDTRVPDYYNLRTLGPGQSTTLRLPYLKDHPQASPAALVLNVTAVNPSQAGYLSVYPSGTDRPATSNVNFKAGQTVPNLVTVPTGNDVQVTVYNFSGTTDVVVDAMGYYQDDTGSSFDAVAPSRLLDTRKSAAVGPDASTSIQVLGAAGVPADATAVVLNLTSTGSDAGGYLTAYASGTARPGTSNLNFAAGQTVANQVVVPIGADGKVSVYNKFGHTHVVADVFGYYGPSGALFTPVVPTRLADTRKQTALGAGKSLKVATGVPAGATAAVLNVTSTASTAGGYLTVWADGAPKPGTSNVNFPAGGTVPNHVTTPLGTNGAFDVYNFAGSTQVVADLFGYFSK